MKKKYINFLFIIIMPFITWQCKETYSQNLPEDFNLIVDNGIIHFDMKNDIVSSKNTVTLNLSITEKKVLYELIKKHDIFNFSNKIQCNVFVTEPRLYNSIKIYANKKEKEIRIVYGSNDKENNCEDIKRADDFLNELYLVLKLNKNYHKLKNNNYFIE